MNKIKIEITAARIRNIIEKMNLTANAQIYFHNGEIVMEVDNVYIFDMVFQELVREIK